MTGGRGQTTERRVMGENDRYGIAGRAAGEAVLRYGHYSARPRSANDAFLLSRIARAVVDALDAHGDTVATNERERWGLFSDDEVRALVMAASAAENEGAFDGESDLAKELRVETQRRGLDTNPWPL
jgi:hypothetical protein